MLKHERGHNTQLMSMGLGNYLIQIGIPSVWKNGDETPWELSASMLGGSALANRYSEYPPYPHEVKIIVNINNIINIILFILYFPPKLLEYNHTLFA